MIKAMYRQIMKYEWQKADIPRDKKGERGRDEAERREKTKNRKSRIHAGPHCGKKGTCLNRSRLQKYNRTKDIKTQAI